MENEKCNGCQIKRFGFHTLDPKMYRCVPASKRGERCPCEECLIKSMCKNSCDKFVQYTLRTYDTLITHLNKKYGDY